MNEIPISLGFGQVGIQQKKNQCLSRLEVGTDSEIIKGIFVKIPLIAANMSTVINAEFAKIIMELGGFAVLHRAQAEDTYLKEVEFLKNNCQWVPVSVGVGDSQYDLGKKLVAAGANVLVIDIAHGFSDSVIDLGRRFKSDFGNDVKVVVGNTTNLQMLYEVADYADAIKVGIAQGFACETMHTAGCAERQFSAVLKFKELSKKLGIPVISDGGISEPADFVKAIGAGANSAMAGKIFAACWESAAKTIQIDGVFYKEYAGMASAYVQENWKGGLKEGTCAEGAVRHIPRTGAVKHLLEWYLGALRSGITYGGGKDVNSFQECVEFVRL